MLHLSGINFLDTVYSFIIIFLFLVPAGEFYIQVFSLLFSRPGESLNTHRNLKIGIKDVKDNF